MGFGHPQISQQQGHGLGSPGGAAIRMDGELPGQDALLLKVWLIRRCARAALSWWATIQPTA
jgi:hypothetical protein